MDKHTWCILRAELSIHLFSKAVVLTNMTQLQFYFNLTTYVSHSTSSTAI